MQDNIVITLKSGNHQLIEVYGEIENPSIVFDAFMQETEKYSVYDLEQHDRLRLDVNCLTDSVKTKIPDSFVRFSNLWDAPIYINFKSK